MRISSPEKVARVLEKVGASGLPLLIRALSSPSTAIKGRAIPVGGSIRESGFKIGNISEQGIRFLAANAAGGIQIEFVLMATKVVFFTSLSFLGRQDCVALLPSYLVSIERRKDTRFPVAGNARAFLSVNSWVPDAGDPATVPFFESTKNLASLLPVGDVSMGGISVVTRFPAACKMLDRGHAIEEVKFYLPLLPAFEVEASVRWCKRQKEAVQDVDGRARISRTYRFGIQFVNPTEELIRNLQLFIQQISQADAI